MESVSIPDIAAIKKELGIRQVLDDGQILDDSYVLWKEMCTLSGLSNPTYQYWGINSFTYRNSRAVFLKKASIPQKHQSHLKKTSRLDGLVQPQPLARYLSISPSTFNPSNGKTSRLHHLFEYHYVAGIKFVKFRKFCLERGLNIPKGSAVMLCREKEIDFSGNIQAHRIIDDWFILWY